ncbi:MAG: zinc ribbon domain-containing protein [Anaerolineae bacterium]|nr:MAG: zinc ribbon domain-containing protein [Anaerolineae bacterium]
MMDGLAVGLGLLIAGAVIAFLAWPWRRQGGAKLPTQDVHGETLNDRYEAMLTALRDLDFDHAVGKVAEDDYASLRGPLLVQAADLMAQLDTQNTAEADLDARLDGEILALRLARHAEEDRVCPVCGRIPSPGDLFCAICGTRLKAECPDCGRSIDPTDRFCAACGAELVPLRRVT